MTTEMMNKLMALGLNKAQATSVTAEKAIQLFMNEDTKNIMLEAEHKVEEMNSLLNEAKANYDDMLINMQTVNNIMLDAVEASKKVTDERARNAIALFSGIMGIGRDTFLSGYKRGGDLDEKYQRQVVESAGYIVYAYLNEDKNSEITLKKDEDEKDD